MMLEPDDVKTFRFGDVIVNDWASRDNPRRAGYFVKQATRKERLNYGRYIELTNGTGDFWQVPADREHRLYRVRNTALQPLPETSDKGGEGEA